MGFRLFWLIIVEFYFFLFANLIVVFQLSFIFFYIVLFDFIKIVSLLCDFMVVLHFIQSFVFEPLVFSGRENFRKQSSFNFCDPVARYLSLFRLNRVILLNLAYYTH